MDKYYVQHKSGQSLFSRNLLACMELLPTTDWEHICKKNLYGFILNKIVQVIVHSLGNCFFSFDSSSPPIVSSLPTFSIVSSWSKDVSISSIVAAFSPASAVLN